MKLSKLALNTAAALALGGLIASGASAEKVLRVNMHSDLKIVDPIWTTAYMSRNYGYMVYDTLFAMNSKAKSNRKWSTRIPSQPMACLSISSCGTG